MADISLEQAHTAVDAALKKSNEMGVKMDIAVVGVASLLALEPGTRRCTRARIALAAVAPTPVRATEAEGVLEGQEITEDLIRQAAERAVEACSPITDMRGSSE